MWRSCVAGMARRTVVESQLRRSWEYSESFRSKCGCGHLLYNRVRRLTADMRVLMITCEWPTDSQPHLVPFIVRQVEFLRKAGVEIEVFAFRGAKNPLNYLRA